MSDDLDRLEQALGRRLNRAATDVADTEAMRERVLAGLDRDLAPQPRIDSKRSRYWNGRSLFVVAGIAAAVALAVVFVPRSTLGPVNVATVDSVDVATSNDGRYETSELRTPLALTPPDEEVGDWFVVSETPDMLTLEFSSPEQAGDGPTRLVRIVVPPANTTPDDVVRSLGSTLFDTSLASRGPGQLGGYDTRVIKLQTEGGTTRLGFKLADNTYLATDGDNRVFLVHITTMTPQTLVFWVEASPEQVDDFEAIAGRLVATLQAD